MINLGISRDKRRSPKQCLRTGAKLAGAIFEALETRRLLSGTWTAVATGAPGALGTMDLLPNGDVIATTDGDGAGSDFAILTPSSTGSYVNGSWTKISNANYTRLFDSTDVLQNGDLFVAGGEYGSGASNGEIYNPLTNVWTVLPAEPSTFLDSWSSLIPNGDVLITPVFPNPGGSTELYNPTTNTWTTGPQLIYGNSADEQSWVKLPDGSILTAGGGQTSERYIPASNSFVADATVPVNLTDSLSEYGPAFLMSNGKAIFFGASGHTAIYTPSGSTSPGSWVAGPDIPDGLGEDDASGAIFRDGTILITAGPIDSYNGPTTFFDYNPTTNSYTTVSGPDGDGAAPFLTRMLVLPNGDILYNDNGSTAYQYDPGTTALAAAVPTITSVTPNSNGSLTLVGTNLNGINIGASYGDDAQMDSNYPVIRLTSGSNVYYASSYSWTNTGVQLGSTSESVNFTLPLGIPAGTYSLVTTANGVPSAATSLTISDNSNHTPPTIPTPAKATPTNDGGTTAALSILGADPGGESSLTYTWVNTGAPNTGSTASFSINGTNAAKNATAIFHEAGTYTFDCVITDAGGLSVTSGTVTVTVTQTLTSLVFAPNTYSLTTGQTQQLNITAYDQFGNTMNAAITWALASGAGSVNNTGLYTAPTTAGTLATVTATSGSIQATATIGVVNAPWTSVDVGAPPLSGTAYDSNNSTTILGTGSDIWTTTDQFHYDYQNVADGGVIIADVNTTPVLNTDGSNSFAAKAGVMFRTSTGATSSFVDLVYTNGIGLQLIYRNGTAATAATADQATFSGSSVYLQLSDVNSVFTGSYSTNGTSWTTLGSYTNTAVGTAALGGLVVTSHNTGEIATETFTHVSLNPPTVATAAAANPTTVTGTTTALSVLGADAGGESTLNYTWAATTIPANVAAPTYSSNGTNASKNTTATFYAAGNYTFTVTINYNNYESVTSSVSVVVDQTLTGITITPNPAKADPSQSLQLTADESDQFGNPMPTQPTSFTWALTAGAGSIGATTGLYHAPATATTATVTASANSLQGSDTITVALGLVDSVFHGNGAYASPPANNPNGALVDSDIGGTTTSVTSAASWAASHAPNYTFINSNDAFIYSGGSGEITKGFLDNGSTTAAGDAAGAALTDPADVSDTIFDAEGYFQTPAANDGGTYTVTIPNDSQVDDLIAVYIDGNGTAGSGTLVASAGWQGTGGGYLNGSRSFTIPAGPNTAAAATVPIEILYANGFGGAFTTSVGGTPATAVQIKDSHGAQVTHYLIAGSNEILPGAPVLTGVPGNHTVQLNWPAASSASSYTVYRYVTSAGSGTAAALATNITALTWTDSTAVNSTNYSYYITANNEGGSTASNTITETPEPSASGPVILPTAVRNSATQVTVSWTAPASGTNYTITRSLTLGGTQTTLATAQTATTYVDTTANDAGNVNYYYTITSVAPDGSQPSTAETVFVGDGTGWSADYYTGTTDDVNQVGTGKPLTGDSTNAVLAFERIDPTIQALTANGVLAPLDTPPGFNSIQTANKDDDYAVRWTGYVEAPVTGYYSFNVASPDDAEEISVYDPNTSAWVNITTAAIPTYNMGAYGFGSYAVPVVGTGADTAGYAFTAGQKVLVQVDYNQGFGGSVANLSWAASSTEANAVAATYDAMAQAPVPTYDVATPSPVFSSVDAFGGSAVTTKDSSYYTFTATATVNATLQLQWNNVPAASYNIYRSLTATGGYTLVNNVPITIAAGASDYNGGPVTYADGGLTNGTKYYYILQAVTQGGSSTVTLPNGTPTTGLQTSGTPVGTAPPAVTGISVTGTNDAGQGVRAYVSFPAVTQATTYTIQRTAGSPSGFVTIATGVTASGSTVDYTDASAGLADNVNYYYQVIPYNGSIAGPTSAPFKMLAVGGPLVTEGTVEYQVEASGYAGNGSTTSIENVGNMGGTFATVGGAVTVSNVADANSTSAYAFVFNGTNSATSSTVTGTDLTGNSSRSIEVWVDNPTIDSSEEAVISYSHRGGTPDGSNMSLSYGSQYGIGLWGAEYDLQFNNAADVPAGAPNTAAPAANTWHYLVFTYNGSYDDVYVDGQLYLQQPIANGGLATFAGFPVNLAAENSSTSSGFIASNLGSLDIASARISAGALTSNDVAANYTAGIPGQGAVAIPSSLPAWLSKASAVIWNPTTDTLTLTGSATILSDPGKTVDPIISANNGAGEGIAGTGATDDLTIDPTIAGSDIHLGGIKLSGGARIAVTQIDTPTPTNLSIGQYVANNQATDHNVIVLGTTTNTADPVFTIDATSKFDLQDNDLIYHTGTKDSDSGAANLLALQTVVYEGRDGGVWDGNGLSSSVAENQDNYDGNETVQLAVVDNNDLGNPFSNWQVGSGPSETLNSDDIIIKYTYTGDLNLDGAVNFTDSLIFNGSYYADPATGNEWAQGNIDGDPNGVVGFSDSLIFNGSYNNGTAQAASADDAVLL